jgi:hypothetical protein
MKRVSLAVLSLAVPSLVGLAATAAPARADDLHLDFGFGVRDGRVRDGYVGVGTDRPVDRPIRVTPAPLPRYVPPTIVTDPAPWPRRDGFDDRDRRRVYVPPHLERRTETVCEPAIYEDRLVPVYEDRVVPVFDDRRVPVYREIGVPVFEDRLVPTFQMVLDRHGRPSRVQIGVHTEHVRVGDRTERVQVGTRLDRVQVGERHEQVQIGTRTERVLVRAETCRVVEREVWVDGRYDFGMPADHDRHHDFERRGDDRR